MREKLSLNHVFGTISQEIKSSTVEHIERHAYVAHRKDLHVVLRLTRTKDILAGKVLGDFHQALHVLDIFSIKR